MLRNGELRFEHMLMGSKAPDHSAHDKYLSFVKDTAGGRGAFHSTWHAAHRPQPTHECVTECGGQAPLESGT